METTTSEPIPPISPTSATLEASAVSSADSTEVTSAASTITGFPGIVIPSNTTLTRDSAFPSSVALETTATEAPFTEPSTTEASPTESTATEGSTTEAAAADATSTDATSGFLTSVLTESSAKPSSAPAETSSRAATTSRPSNFFPINNGTAPGASGVAEGGKPHGTGAVYNPLVTGISGPSGTGGIRFGNSTQTASGFSSAVTSSGGGGSESLTTLTTVSDGVTQTLVTALPAQTSGVARNGTATPTEGSNSGARRSMDTVGGALVAGVAGVLGMLLL